jgi:hypothetical protein
MPTDLVPFGTDTGQPGEVITDLGVRTSAEILADLNRYAVRPVRGRRIPRYLSLAFCNVLTIHAFKDVQEALRAKRWIDDDACGHVCRNWHAVLDVETRQYVTASCYDLFTTLYPPLPTVWRGGPHQGWQHRVFMPGHSVRGPWIGYTLAADGGRFTYQAGSYRGAVGWRQRLDDAGLRGLLDWISYELAPPGSPWHGPRMRSRDHVWAGPRLTLLPLLGSLHAFLTTVTRRCDRAMAQGAYYEAHPELPRWHAISAHDLCALSEEQCQHDWWCDLREGPGDETCTCTWPIEYGPLPEPSDDEPMPEPDAAPRAIETADLPPVPVGHVYIFQAVGTRRIKIGRSARLRERHHTIHTASPYPVALLRAIATEDAHALERALHQRYERYRQHREWFELPPEDLLALLREDFFDA